MAELAWSIKGKMVISVNDIPEMRKELIIWKLALNIRYPEIKPKYTFIPRPEFKRALLS